MNNAKNYLSTGRKSVELRVFGDWGWRGITRTLEKRESGRTEEEAEKGAIFFFLKKRINSSYME